MNLSRVLFVGAPYEVASRESRSLEQCFEATGRNTGNLLIGHGLFTQLRYDKLEPFRYAMSPEYVEENFDQVVIAAANFLYPGFDFTPVSSFLDKIRLPVFMVGLGAQLPSAQAELQNIPDGTWRLVRIASERSHSIGVRGNFTAEQLCKHGIKNVQVTGCPSLYTGLKSSIRIRRLQVLDRVVVNGSRNVVGHAFDKDVATKVERQLFRLALSHKLPYVLQNEQPEMQIANGEDTGPHEPAINSLAKFFGTSAQEFVEFYREHGKVFFSIKEWFDWIGRCDFSIGTRFHGNIAALLNGVPAMILTHDSRTRELCDFAAIPSVGILEARELDIERMYEAADYDLFEKNYREIYVKYVDFLDANGVPHKFPAPDNAHAPPVTGR